MKKYINLILWMGCWWISTAQPRYYMGKDSVLYWNKKLPVYIHLSDGPQNQGVNLESKEFSKYTNPIFFDTEGPNYVRTKYAVDNHTGALANPKLEIAFEVIADGVSPVSTANFKNAPSFTKGSTNYFGPGLTVSIESQDKYSGVEKTSWYDRDSTSKSNYSGSLSFGTEGEHQLHYFSEDHVGNIENENIRNFIVDLSPPEVTYNINGVNDNNTIPGNATIYFTGVDRISGLRTIYYKFDSSQYAAYSGGNLSLNHLEDGNHTLYYMADDNVTNKSPENKYEFYYDKIAPITASDILGDKYIWQDKVYFSGRTKMKLTAIDNKSGVKNIYFSIDNEPFKIYEDPFYLPNVQGNHIVKFYSVDRLANTPSGAEEYKHNINRVILDLTGPDIENHYEGPFFKTRQDLFIGPKTKIFINARDAQAGVQKIAYSVDRDQAETNYSNGFQLNIPSGKHTLELFAYDNVNNRNTVTNPILFDNDVPQLFTRFSTAPLDTSSETVYPPYVTLFFAATDQTVGNDKIFYSVNGSNEIAYGNPISNLTPGKKYQIVVRAVDKVGNESKQELRFSISDK